MTKSHVFISYSGERSRLMAFELADLFVVLFGQKIKPQICPEAKGEFMANELTRALDELGFAVLCITPENRRSRWMHLEAGALMKPVGKNRVVPLVYDMSLQGLDEPFKWFCGESATIPGMVKLLDVIATRFGVGRWSRTTAESRWRDTLAKLERLTQEIASRPPVGRENHHQNRILDNLQTIDDHRNRFRKYLAHQILADVYAATNELAHVNIVDYRPPEAYVRETVGFGTDWASLTNAEAVFALCGGKPWEQSTVDYYYERNYEFARLAPGRLVKRIFVERGVGGFEPRQLAIMKKHRSHRNHGVQARVLKCDRRIPLRGIDPILNTLIDEGFGFFIVRRKSSLRAFTHYGGLDHGGPFRYAKYREWLSTHQILNLFEVLDSNCEDF